MNIDKFRELLSERFGWCGCSSTIEIINPIKIILSWANSPAEDKINGETLFIEKSLFYIVAGILSDLDYIEHGSAIRYSWTTDEGKDLLKFIESLTPNLIASI